MSALPLHSLRETGCLVIDEAAPEPLFLTARDFIADAAECCGRQWTLQHERPAQGGIHPVIAGVYGESPLLEKMGYSTLPELVALKDLWDAYVIYPAGNALIVCGSNARGAMYGLYTASEHLFGTDPMKAFTDVGVEMKDHVEWSGGIVTSGEPRFRYRGIFINDEDALMSWRGEAEDGIVAPEVHAMIIESVCRLGGNMLAPPMWAGYMDDDSRRLVERRGLFYTASHLEILLSNPQNYFDAWCKEKLGKSIPYSFSRYPEEVSAYWRDSVRRHREFRNIWPVGLRGITDCALWESDPYAPSDMPARARLVSGAIRRQTEILAEELDGREVVMTLTMRDEVLDLFDTGELDLPEAVILVWDDLARKSVMRRLPEAEDRERAGRHGAYYHLNFCQDPRMQYLPAKILTGEINRITGSGATDFLLFNAGNVREIALLLQWGMKVAWDPVPYSGGPEGTRSLVRETVVRTFGHDIADTLTDLYEDVTATEYRFRVSQVTDCVAPLITSHELYDIWDNTSALDRIEEEGSVNGLPAFARGISFTDLPDRCWCFDPDALDGFFGEWKSLKERVDALESRIPERARAFFEANLRLQVATSMAFCEWALEVLNGFRHCETSEFKNAALCFEKAADALDTLEEARHRSAAGKWENWFRGEYSNVFKKSLWTLKPRWHAADTRRLAELLR